MSKLLLKGALGKFSEAFGSGLAYGIVAVAAMFVLKFVIFRDEPIAQFTAYTTTCEMNSDAGDNCQAEASCRTGFVAIGGECTVRDKDTDKSAYLQNFALLEPKEGSSKESTRFRCNWGTTDGSKKALAHVKPMVRAVCIDKTRFEIQLHK